MCVEQQPLAIPAANRSVATAPRLPRDLLLARRVEGVATLPAYRSVGGVRSGFRQRVAIMDRRSFRLWLLASAALVLASGCGGPPAESPGEAPATADAPADDFYFPPAAGDWETIAPADVGWSEEGLAAVLEYAREQRSSGVVILHRGRILAEAHWQVLPEEGGGASRYQNLAAERTDDGRVIEDVASVQKSVVSFLVGVARGRKLLDLDDPLSRHLGTGWSRAAAEDEAGILLRHVMSMSSGLDTDAVRVAAPGELWSYNTNVYSRTVDVLVAASGLEIEELTREWLTEPVGMSDSGWGPRPWVRGGDDANRIGFRTTARDLARFGLLVLADGAWQGRDLIGDAGYLAESLSPSQPMNPAYGLLWWLNGQASWLRLGSGEPVDGPLIPSAPKDTVAAQGALGRKLFVTPSLDLVVTRLGDQPEPDFNEQLWRRLMAAAPGGS